MLISRILISSATALVLVACGGGGGSSTVGGTSTTLSGAVVKGPVDGAQVCAYALAGNAQGALLGACVTTDSNGNYTLTLPVGSGPLWLQATGGTYIDEATSVSTLLSAGGPLSTLITANGSTVNAMLTPLTTLALNSAVATVGGSGTLNTAAFSAAATQLLSTFNLPAGLDINGTLPAFSANINDYGRALTAISQMVKNGTKLADLLANDNPSALAAAYATAVGQLPTQPTPVTPVTPTAPTLGAITASGSLTSDSAIVETFVPRSGATSNEAPFGTTVSAGNEAYTFRNEIRSADATGNSAGVAAQSITVTRSSSGLRASLIEITFVKGFSLSVIRDCAEPCAGLTLTPTVSGTGVNLNFSNVTFKTGSFNTLPNPPTVPVVMNGSLAGEMPGGYLFTSQLPAAASGSLRLDGADVPIAQTTFAYPVTGVTDPSLYPQLAFTTPRGLFYMAITTQDGTTPIYNASFLQQPEGRFYRLVTTPSTLTTADDTFRINLASATLTRSPAGSLVVDAALTVGKTGGTVTISGDGSFTAQTSRVFATSQSITYSFDSPVPRGSPVAFANISVTLKNGVVTTFVANTASGASYSCSDTSTLFGARCEGTVTVSADRRTLTFNSFRTGRQLSSNSGIAIAGSLTASGL